jgi:hypothetical protein
MIRDWVKDVNPKSDENLVKKIRIANRNARLWDWQPRYPLGTFVLFSISYREIGCKILILRGLDLKSLSSQYLAP